MQSTPSRATVLAVVATAATLLHLAPARAQFVAWDQCSFNGGTRICTFPEPSKWKFSYGPFVQPGPLAPAWCYGIRFDALSADTPNEIYDKVSAMYTQDRIDACFIDISLPYVRAENCNAKPESLGTFNNETSYYAAEHPLYNQFVVELNNCSMPYHDLNRQYRGETRPPWRELVCKYGTPAVSPSGQPFCLGDGLPESKEDLGPPPCGNGEGNPIDVATGNKYQREADYERGPRGLTLARHYNSQVVASGSFGRNWSTEYDARLSIGIGSVATTVAALRGDGSMVAFKAAGLGFVPVTTSAAYRLAAQRGAGGAIIGWVLSDRHAGHVETYTSNGRLASIVSRDGYARTVSTNSGGWISAVTDSFGRTLTFAYGASDDPDDPEYGGGTTLAPNFRKVTRITDESGSTR